MRKLIVRIMGGAVMGLVIAGVAGCSSCCFRPAGPPAAGTVQRFGWVTGLKPEKLARYKELHAHCWPSVQKMITACHLRNYSIYLREIAGKPYLFSYVEYTGTDFAADMKRMTDDPETQRWWKETDPCQAPLPDAAAKGKIWSDTEEVFHQN